MRKNPFSTTVFLGCLALAVAARADLVTEPLRKFGLGDLLQVAIAPDRQWMATCGSGGAFLWNFQEGAVVHRLEGHHARVSALRFSPDGAALLTGGFDTVIRAWNVETGKELRSFRGHAGAVWDLAFSPDGRSFASVGGNTTRIWSFETGELLRTLVVPGASVVRARFTPDGNRVVTADGSLTNNVRVWDLATGETIRSFGHLVQHLSFVAGGHLVTAGSDVAVQVWNVETGEIVRPLTGAAQLVVGLESSTNSPLVVAGGLNGQIITWDASTGDVTHSFLGETLGAIAIVPGTNQILTAHQNNLVRLKNRQTGDNLRVFGGHTTSTSSGVGFSADGRYVVSGGTEPLTRLWIRTNAAAHTVIPGHGAGTQSAAFSPDGTRVLTTFGAPVFSARLSNPQSGLTEREFFGHSSWLFTAVFSPDGTRVATGAQDGTARLWDAASGGLLRTFATPGALIRSVAVSSNNLLFASGATDGIVRLWNATNGQLLRTFELNAGAVTSLAFSPANGDLLVAWADGFLRTFDSATGELKLDSIAPAAFLETAAYSPDGRFILGGEGWPFFTARLWDAGTGRELRVFAGHAAPVTAVAFNASGTSILTGADFVRLWSIADIAARLETDRESAGLELRWHLGTLQHAPLVTGPWTDVPNAVSPWIAATNQPAAFFRVRVDGRE